MLVFLENISLDNDMAVSRILVCLFKALSDSSVVNTVSKVKIAYVFGK